MNKAKLTTLALKFGSAVAFKMAVDVISPVLSDLLLDTLTSKQMDETEDDQTETE